MSRTAHIPHLMSALALAGVVTATVPAAAQNDSTAGNDSTAEPAEDLSESAWSDESSWDIPGEYVVDFRDETEPGVIASVMSSLGLTFRPSALEASTRIEVVKIPGALTAVLAKLRGDEHVEGVEPHARVRALFLPDDPMFDQQWHLSQVQAERAWGMSVGRGVTVAVIDTGIACENFDEFQKATDLASTRCVEGRNFVSKGKRANDDHGHGTHVAGTIAQSTHNGLGASGLAFGARLMPVKVLSGNGWGTTTGVADGIRWAADNGAQVINLSLGSPRDSRVLQAAIDHAKEKGVVVVAAAGNSGGSVGYPGASKGVIGVSATDEENQLAWFSSRGDGVDIAAPGVNVLQQTICNRGRNGCEVFPKYNGTSMASPHVAGAAAMLVSLGVTDPDAVEQQLLGSAKVLDDSDAGRKKFGAGLLQAGDAAEGVLRTQTTTRWLALLAMLTVAMAWARRRGKAQGSEVISAASPALWLGAVTAGVGVLFFAPWVASRHLVWVDLLSRPLGEWDMLLGANVHAILPLANVLVPLLFAAVLLRAKSASGWVAGISIGTAGYLASVAWLGQLATPFGSLLTLVWCAVNALACLYLASLLLVRRA